MLRLPKNELSELKRYAEAAYPNECCGVLLGVRVGADREVRQTVPCANAARFPRTTYEIAPKELIAILRGARERKLEAVGFYHSHPDHPARWSPTDLELAHWIGCSYVIVSLENGAVNQVDSFLLSGTREESKAFVAEEMVTE